MNFKEALASDIPIIHDLASIIWNEHYPSIIGQAQVDYMLDLMYSPSAISADMEKGICYFLAFNKEPVGFAAIEVKDDEAFIHKMYVLKEQRGVGLAGRFLDYLEKEISGKASHIRLQVNRMNVRAINFYFKNGFRIEYAIDKSIGEGFAMEDFLMIKPLH